MPRSPILASFSALACAPNVPGGTQVQPVLATTYGVYARVWNSANPVATFKRVDIAGGADLRAGSASGVNVVLN